jgi:hypothetical protein
LTAVFKHKKNFASKKDNGIAMKLGSKLALHKNVGKEKTVQSTEAKIAVGDEGYSSSNKVESFDEDSDTTVSSQTYFAGGKSDFKPESESSSRDSPEKIKYSKVDSEVAGEDEKFRKPVSDYSNPKEQISKTRMQTEIESIFLDLEER